MPAHSGSSHGWVPVHRMTAKRMQFTTVFILLNVHLLHTCVREDGHGSAVVGI